MEIKACLPWLEEEFELVKPETLVCLGSTFRVTRERGTFVRSNLTPHVMAIVHPSSLLRIEDDAARKDAIWIFVRELRKVAVVLSDEG